MVFMDARGRIQAADDAGEAVYPQSIGRDAYTQWVVDSLTTRGATDVAKLPIDIRQPKTLPEDDLTPHPDRYNSHYLRAYLGAVAGGLSQRGMVIHAVVLTSTQHSLNCSIAFAPPPQPAGLSPPAWVAYRAGWDEHLGWCCYLHHIDKDQSKVRRYLGEPLVATPRVVVDFMAGLSRVQTLGILGPGSPPARRHHTPQELADELIRFTPSCTWLG